MNIDIRQAVIENLKQTTDKEILETISDAASVSEENVLPGLGVLFEVYWKHIDQNERMSISKVLASSFK